MKLLFILGATSTALGNTIVTLVSFLLLFWLVKRVAWKPLMGMLEERERVINADLDKAAKNHEISQQQRSETEVQLREARTNANELLSKAQLEGSALQKTIIKEANEDAQRIRQQAQREVAAERIRTLNNMRSEISGLSIDIAEKIIGRELTSSDHERLVDEFIQGLED
ncbi:F0F1 ATP synthase subunit B [Jeotgalibaca porci]|uniref:F0F1 ATP synthase subunit B n=2 Tax=Jeotgalibaca porci TaxID=1868793 RepID=UPI00359FFB84